MAPMGLSSLTMNFNFLILCSSVVLPEIYGISSHSTHVYKYNFTKEYESITSWKAIAAQCTLALINFAANLANPIKNGVT